MYARVVTFENAGNIDETAKRIEEGDRPEGVPSSASFVMLADHDAGKVVSVTFFDTEADLAAGDAALNAMSPPGGGFGERTSVDLMKVVARKAAGE